MIAIEYPEKLYPILSTPKRMKGAIGGRGSAKTTSIADYVLALTMSGQVGCCGREFQNSINDSVHSTLCDEIDRLKLPGFEILATEIRHASGGRIFYRGLSRNVESLKSLNCHWLWVEEAETLSDETIKILTASMRLSAAEKAKRKELGLPLDPPEIILTMNRGKRGDPVSKKFLARAEKSLRSTGHYEDDRMMFTQINFDEIPKKWFEESGLEVERADDEANMSKAEYRSKWYGEYWDEVEDAIIEQDWFDACIDAHEKLSFGPVGHEAVAFDPSDVGNDPEALAHSHGNIILQAMMSDLKGVEKCTEWACGYAKEKGVDAFTWDADGLGAGITYHVGDLLKDSGIKFQQFKGSHEVDRPKDVYQELRTSQNVDKQKLMKDVFRNQRSQHYFLLRDRIKKTYRAVVHNETIDSSELISFSSNITHLEQLRTELCSIPRKYIPGGELRVLSKPEMLKLKIASPNIADCVMMLQKPIDIEERKPIKLNKVTW